jgi:1-acyl-sn-glycerol-3-phosphate acyltransferase
VLLFRSLLFNVAFYLNVLVYMLAAVPTLLMPRRIVLAAVKSWARTSLWLLKVICGTKVEFRGLEQLPHGAFLVAAKHQSAWETFALIPLFADPAFILKRELMWIPIFGWYNWRTEMIPVDRGARAQALAQMTERSRAELRRDRQIIIFPEGTRRRPGAEPKYKQGVGHLYAATGAPCVPIALNSGLYWPRRSFRRHPGTVRVEILPPIPPGLDKKEFMRRLQDDIESATARLVEEGRRELAGLTSAQDEPALTAGLTPK